MIHRFFRAYFLVIYNLYNIDFTTVLSDVKPRCIIQTVKFFKGGKFHVFKGRCIEIKKEKNAIILAHYYVDGAVQDVADFVGDSYALAKKAKNTDADIIVFAGVKFMGESAKMLNPDKKVLMPDLNADCPMAHMASKAVIKKMKEEYEDLAVVCYINSTAELKTMADICVTSSNAVKIVRSLPNKNIFFIPDGNLGAYVKKQVPEKNIILNDGYCITHKRVTLKDVEKAREEHPNVPIIVHPECVNEVVEATDFAGSTSELIQYTVDNPSKEFVIGTELGVLHEMQLKSPDKTFYPLSDKLICMNMKKVSLEKVYDCLLNETNEVFVDEEVKAMAEKSLDRMLELAK